MANGESDMTTPIKSYRDLTVWQDAMDLAVALYELTRSFPKDELYGLTAQLRRAGTSVPANIAEGHGREHTRSFIQFLRVSQGSLKEVETHLYLSERIGLVTTDTLTQLIERCDSLGRRLRALIRSLEERIGKED
jgi:four helix bundle protein